MHDAPAQAQAASQLTIGLPQAGWTDNWPASQQLLVGPLRQEPGSFEMKQILKDYKIPDKIQQHTM